ncbi:MAG: hypothetical protein LBH60_09525 [Prevotellaceae bacterium]|jgi:hypothetical protein|nr:hypothetical protein [Prevotellaceae bacterium]
MINSKIINIRLYRGIVFACLILFSGGTFAQRNPKYENTVKKAAELSREEAFGEYSDFLSLNPYSERANLYYQLAELASSMMKDLNPVTDYNRIKSLYNASDKYYLICRQYIDDNEARKDQSLFPAVRTFQRKLSAQDVNMYITTKRSIDSIFFAETAETFNSYASMIEAYYRCMDIYKNICKNNRNINDLYINWDETKTALSAITRTFDSIMYFKNIIDDKIPALNFSYKSINVFKTDGISPPDFRNVAELWDYKLWAAGQQKYYDETIYKTVESTKIAERKLDMQIDDIKESDAPLTMVNYTGKNLMDELKKLQDLTPAYFIIERKHRIIDFLNLAYDARNIPSAAEYSVDAQSAYIRSLIEAYRKISDIDEKMKTDYPSIKQNPSETESLYNLYTNSIDNYKQYVVNSKIAGKENSFVYGKANIPKVTGSGFYRPSGSGYIVKSIVQNDDGSVCLGGASINSQGYSVAFTAFGNDIGAISWIKTIDVAKMIYDDCAMSVCRTPSGVMSLISSKNVSDPALTIQTVVTYDIKGVEKNKFNLTEKNLPLARNILYDEISESILLAFYGSTEDWFRDSILIIQNLAKDSLRNFRTEIKLSGELIGIFPSENGQFILFGNYAELDVRGKKESAALGIFSLIIDSEGKVVKSSVYPSVNPRYGICVNRVSPEMFMISGTGGSIRKNNAELSSSEGEPVVILTYGNGDLVYDYKKKL